MTLKMLTKLVILNLITYTSSNVIELIQKYNYPIERHQNIQTSDGYVLELHRIPNSGSDKKVVFLMHAVFSSSVQWLVMGPHRSLGFILADLGYDVWMGNARGTTWSRKHIEYDPDRHKKFWDFSFHEIGVYDLPAMIDYVLLKTGQESLYFVGHSQGSTSFFIMGSERPEYNRKIRFMGALAPAAYESHFPLIFVRLLTPFSTFLEKLADFLNINEVTGYGSLATILGNVLCNNNLLTGQICAGIFPIASFINPKHFDKGIIPTILANDPSGASIKQLFHYLQEMKSGCFCRYDNGQEKNLKIYGQTNPPVYDLGRITAPVGLYYSKGDLIVSPTDVRRLRGELNNSVVDYVVPRRDYGHIDFIWATDSATLVYDQLVKNMEQF